MPHLAERRENQMTRELLEIMTTLYANVFVILVFLDLTRFVNTVCNKHCSLVFFVFGRLGEA